MKPRTALTMMAVLPLAVMVALIYGWYVLYISLPNTVMDFSALWHTTDSVNLYLRKHKKWPQTWDDLADATNETNAGYGTSKNQPLRNRVDVNFEITLQSAHDADWLVRLQSSQLPGEIEAANKRLRYAVEVAGAKVRSEADGSDELEASGH